MSSLIDIVEKMAEVITAALDGSNPTVQVSAYRLINPTPPTVDIYPGDPLTDGSATGFGSGKDEAIFTVRARIGTGDIEESQKVLLAMMDDQSPLSIAAALEADQTLEGIVASLVVNGPSGHTIYQETSDRPPLSLGALLGVDWTVKMIRLKAA